MNSNGIKKPKVVKVSKGSDRRAASARKAASYLKTVNHTTTTPTTRVLSSDTIKDDTKTVKRSGGGKTWEDQSLLEWNPKHFRLFVGNLGDDVDDQLLFNSFNQYPTMSKVKVPIDNKSQKNKGYGFVAFESPDDYFKAFQEMNGKYVGLHPIQLKRAETKIKATKKR